MFCMCFVGWLVCLLVSVAYFARSTLTCRYLHRSHRYLANKILTPTSVGSTIFVDPLHVRQVRFKVPVAVQETRIAEKMSTTDPVSSHRGNKYGVQKVLPHFPVNSEMTQISLYRCIIFRSLETHRRYREMK
jgi:hypothetical protein